MPANPNPIFREDSGVVMTCLSLADMYLWVPSLPLTRFQEYAMQNGTYSFIFLIWQRIPDRS